mmetsp:Transcript_83526/g.166790  ORF Transcript_83526/g.166790 Transcript_83526/m.166790 type:complete len:215 (-) Transcript_83526:96-740(-)
MSCMDRTACAAWPPLCLADAAARSVTDDRADRRRPPVRGWSEEADGCRRNAEAAEAADHLWDRLRKREGGRMLAAEEGGLGTVESLRFDQLHLEAIERDSAQGIARLARETPTIALPSVHAVVCPNAHHLLHAVETENGIIAVNHGVAEEASISHVFARLAGQVFGQEHLLQWLLALKGKRLARLPRLCHTLPKGFQLSACLLKSIDLRVDEGP